MIPQIDTLRQTFKTGQNSENAAWMKAYLKGQFEFFGIKTPQRKELQKDWLKSHRPQSSAELRTLVNALWAAPEREFQYTALELLKRNWKLLDPTDLSWLKSIIERKTWWDTVDILATSPLGWMLKHHDIEDAMDEWIQDGNFWIRRCALIFQLKYKEDLDWSRLQNYILQTSHEKEFFIRKAIGWSLRQHAKCKPEEVIGFVNSHPELSPLSKREALKHLR